MTIAHIGFLWDVVRKEMDRNDQRVVNGALDRFGIRWLKPKGHSGRSVDGVCKNGLKVTALSQAEVCRNKCTAYSSERSRTKIPYIIHRYVKNSGKRDEGKRNNAAQMNVWWLAKDWNSAARDDRLKGTEWLASLQMGV